MIIYVWYLVSLEPLSPACLALDLLTVCIWRCMMIHVRHLLRLTWLTRPCLVAVVRLVSVGLKVVLETLKLIRNRLWHFTTQQRVGVSLTASATLTTAANTAAEERNSKRML